MPEVIIHLELTLPLEGLTVNALMVLLKQILMQLIPQLVAAWLTAWQEHELTHWLGPRWGGHPPRRTPWACPGCNAQEGFTRRGSRPRVLRKTSWGRIAFPLQQVTCRRCGKTFAPLAKQLQLAPYQASTSEYRACAVQAACQLSYRRAARLMSQRPLSASVSAAGIHNWVQQTGAEVDLTAEPVQGHTLVVDGTKVKAGVQPNGSVLHLGMALLGRRVSRGRAQLKKRLVALGVGQTWMASLRGLVTKSPERIVYDGETELAAALDTLWPSVRRQRCLWHLPKHLYYALWKDGLSKAEWRPIQARLQELLYRSAGLRQARAAYQALQDELRLEGLEWGATYLRIAQPHVFTFWERPRGCFSDRAWLPGSRALLATSPLEREMREINRRTNNGCRWSVAGVRNLVSLQLTRRYDPVQWRSLWQLPSKQSLLEFDVKVQVEPVSCLSNVNTT